MEDVHNDLFIFLRMTQLRAFYLEVAIPNFDRLIKEMNVYVPTEDSNDLVSSVGTPSFLAEKTVEPEK